MSSDIPDTEQDYKEYLKGSYAYIPGTTERPVRDSRFEDLKDLHTYRLEWIEKQTIKETEVFTVYLSRFNVNEVYRVKCPKQDLTNILMERKEHGNLPCFFKDFEV